MPRRPAIEAVFTITPAPEARRCGTVYLAPRKHDLTFTAMTWSHISVGISSTALAEAIPAMLTNTSRPPSSVDGRRSEPGDVLFAGRVGTVKRDRPARCADLGGQLLAPVGLDVAEHDRGSAFGEQPDTGRADAAGTTEEHHSLAVHSRFHSISRGLGHPAVRPHADESHLSGSRHHRMGSQSGDIRELTRACQLTDPRCSSRFMSTVGS